MILQGEHKFAHHPRLDLRLIVFTLRCCRARSIAAHFKSHHQLLGFSSVKVAGEIKWVLNTEQLIVESLHIVCVLFGWLVELSLIVVTLPIDIVFCARSCRKGCVGSRN